MSFSKTMSKRVEKLHDELIAKALGDRSGEWFNNDMFPDFFSIDPAQYGLKGQMKTKSIIVRRAVAIDVMLKAMTSEECSRTTGTAEIREGDLLLGVLPMGSNGLGKIFPQYMTDDELRAGSITNRNTGSLFGHNTIDYTELLNDGLTAKIAECDRNIQRLVKAENKLDRSGPRLATRDLIDQDSEAAKEIYGLKSKKDFYVGVKIACQAVIDYAERFARIAEIKAATAEAKRRDELLEMARIARKVPAQPAETFHEAMQSITFYHLALHSAMNFISLGRLDQVLQPFLARDLDRHGQEAGQLALEIFECFIIKLAGRLNLSSDYLCQQDHVDYATVLGTHPYYIDQKAGVNNFLQNIIIGGKTPAGDDAVNTASYLILQAFVNTNLSTPGIYARLGRDSDPKWIEAVAEAQFKTQNNPAVLNDETMIPALYTALMQDHPEALAACNPFGLQVRPGTRPEDAGGQR